MRAQKIICGPQIMASTSYTLGLKPFSFAALPARNACPNQRRVMISSPIAVIGNISFSIMLYFEHGESSASELSKTCQYFVISGQNCIILT
jgi:hypothetical protein